MHIGNTNISKYIPNNDSTKEILTPILIKMKSSKSCV